MKIVDKIIVIMLIGLLLFCNNMLKNDYAIMQNNVEALLDTVTFYKTKDSLNAAQVKELVLEKSQYEKYRAEDAAIIKQLKIDKPKEIIKTSVVTNTEIVTKFDTVYVDSAKHFYYDDNWTKVNGLVYEDSVKLNIENYEELLVVEGIQKKKFWFIKLPVKLFGYKYKSVNVISKNPHTHIKSAEFITFK